MAVFGLLLSVGHLAIAVITADIERLAQQTMHADTQRSVMQGRALQGTL
jgi:hypothetical protein